MKKVVLTILLVLATSALYAQHIDCDENAHPPTMKDSVAVVQVLDDFHSAIINNNQEKALSLLSEDARVLESGSIETKDAYLAHHFHADGKFLKAMEREIKSRTVRINGNTAWVTTQSHAWGTYHEQKLSLRSLELTVLNKKDGRWKIAALHWSSRKE